MKMNAKALAPLAIVAAFGLGTLAPHAQTPPQKLGFVDVDAMFRAHPVGKQMGDIQDKADKELADLDKQIKAIDAKGTSATAAEKQTRETLIATLKSKADAYDKQLQPFQDKIPTIEKSVDDAVNSVAKAQGFSVVMSRNVAARSGLVIYADPSTELTQAAIKVLKP